MFYSMDLNRSIITNALKRLGECATEEGLTLEVCLYGGTLMMLAYDARNATKDVDAVVQPAEVGKRLIKKVAKELQLPENWLNDDVRMFIAPKGETRNLPLQFQGLHLTAPTAAYLLAMKAMACRPSLPGNEGDLDDLRFLIRKLEITSVSQIQATIDTYYPDDVLPPQDKALLDILIAEAWA